MEWCGATKSVVYTNYIDGMTARSVVSNIQGLNDIGSMEGSQTFGTGALKAISRGV